MKSRHYRTILAIVFFVTALLIGTIASNAGAEDKMLETTVDSATVALDKNGNEYVRLIVTETRSLSGVEYQKSLPVMAFGENVEPAKTYQAGDAIKAVANKRTYNGQESYTVISFVK